MKKICTVPIKSHSERLKDKNFLVLGDRPLYQHMLTNIVESNSFDRICVDTDSDSIKKFCDLSNITVIDRLDKFATNHSHGNDILMYDYSLYPDYDLYFQMHVTCPFLRSVTIRDSVLLFEKNLNKYDSMLTCTVEHSHLWMYDQPLYRIDINPRTQDENHIYRESSGVFGITKQSLLRYNKRTGSKVLKYVIDSIESIDIDHEIDFIYAQIVYEKIQNGELGISNPRFCHPSDLSFRRRLGKE